LELPETNLKDFLDSVIAKDPRYRWKLERGVIHVWPVSERDTLLATLLDTKVSHFSIIGQISRNRIYDDIMSLPEISSKLVSAGVEPLTFNGPGSWAKLGENTFFDESNLTLRELLDRIVLKTEIRQWVLSRWGKNSEYISLKG
jgi:serine/threonine protein kinase